MDVSSELTRDDFRASKQPPYDSSFTDELNNILHKITTICRTEMALLIKHDAGSASVIECFGNNETLYQQTLAATNTTIPGNETGKIYELPKNRNDEPEANAPAFYLRVPVDSPADEQRLYLCVSDSRAGERPKGTSDLLHLYADKVALMLQVREQQTMLDRYSLLLDQSADASLIIENESGKIDSIFQKPDHIFGLSSEELRGQQLSKFIGNRTRKDGPVEDWFSDEQNKSGIYTLETQVRNHSSRDGARWLNLNFIRKDNVWLVSINDVTDKKAAEKNIDQLRDTFKKVVQVATDLIYELDWQSGKLSWGDELTNVLGYPDSERFVDYDWWLDKVHPDDLEHVIHDVSETVKGDNSKLQLVYRIRMYDGTYKYVMNRTHVERDADGTPSDVVGAIVDISDLVKSKELSEHHRRSLEQLTENAWSATWIRDDSGRFIFSNGKYRELFDLGVEDVTGKHLSDLFDTDTADKKQQRDAKVIKTQDPLIYEKEISIDGEKKFYKVNLFPMHGMPGLKDLVGGVAVDITTEKRSREEVETSLKEKETLLKEIHHRVKNNLSVVSGMIQLQAFKEKDESVRKKLFASTGRIKTMAMIHELLYNTVSFSDLRFDEIIKKLIKAITDTYDTSVDLDMHYALDSVELNINQAIPCSLIVNEVVTNVLKHGYRDGDTGNLKVSLREDNDIVVLRIRDDGRGLPDDFDKRESSDSLGMELIETLANQISGDYNYKSMSDGAEFSIIFNKRGLPEDADSI